MQHCSRSRALSGRDRWKLALLAVTVGLLLASPLLVRADIFSIDGKLIEVEVRNQWQYLLPKAKISCTKSWGKIIVTANAPGYQEASTSISPSSGQNSYVVALTLRDPAVSLYCYNLAEQKVVSAYFEKGQEGVETQTYAVKVLIPKKSWPHPNAGNIDVCDTGFRLPLKTSCQIKTRDDFYDVRMTISREALGFAGGKLVVFVNTEASLMHGEILKWLQALRRVEKFMPFPGVSVSTFALFLYKVLPRDQVLATGDVPESLRKLYREQDRFEALHDPAEQRRAALNAHALDRLGTAEN